MCNPGLDGCNLLLGGTRLGNVEEGGQHCLLNAQLLQELLDAGRGVAGWIVGERQSGRG